MPARSLALITVLALAAPAAAQPRLDALGDPLPPGAVARLGTVRLRHAGTVRASQFSPDGTRLASVDESGWLHLWDAATGKELWRVRCDARRGYVGSACLAFSPDGTLLAVALDGGEDTLHQRDAATGKELRALPGHAAPALAAVFVDAGKTLVTAHNDGAICRWDVATGKRTDRWQPLDEPKAAGEEKPRLISILYGVIDTTGEHVALAVRWDIGDSRHLDELLVLHPGQRKVLWRVKLASRRYEVPAAFSADGKLIAVTAAKAHVALHETANGNVRREFNESAPVNGVLFAAQPETLVVVLDTTEVRIYNPDTLKLRLAFMTGDDGPSRIPLGAVALAAGAKTLAFSPTPRLLAIWDARAVKQLAGERGHVMPVTHVRFDPDGRRLWSSTPGPARRGSRLLTWDLGTAASVASSFFVSRLEGRGPGHFASWDQAWVVLAGDGGVRVTDRASAKVLVKVQAAENGFDVFYGSFSPGKRYLVLPIPSQRCWQILDAATGKEVSRLELDYEVHFAAGRFGFSPDEQLLAFADRQANLHVVDVATGKPRWHLPRPGNKPESDIWQAAFAFSPDGRFLAAWWSEGDGVRVWDLRTGKERLRLPSKPLSLDYRDRIGLAFSPDGCTLATTGLDGDNAVQLWEVASGRLRWTLAGHRGPVLALAFSPDGRLLASGSEDTTVLVWDVYGTMP
jgi:WD40 repeat protein